YFVVYPKAVKTASGGFAIELIRVSLLEGLFLHILLAAQFSNVCFF
ncbi:unnamed protein product, partial [Larinioides sclopetarius]